MLTGDEIPLESRILAVADVYAALTAERPHRGALSDEEAKKILLNAAGTQLDPELAQTFCAVAGRLSAAWSESRCSARIALIRSLGR